LVELERRGHGAADDQLVGAGRAVGLRLTVPLHATRIVGGVVEHRVVPHGFASAAAIALNASVAPLVFLTSQWMRNSWEPLTYVVVCVTVAVLAAE
jgi:hypothetical protein